MSAPVIHAEAIPAAIRIEKQWAVRREKVPHIPGTERKAKSNTPATWRTFEEARSAVESGQADGLYYALRTDSGIVGVDLDHCVTDGVIDPWAMVYVRLLNSYTCLSASGTGIRILIKGKKPHDRCKVGPVECYECDRFLSITDERVPGTPDTIEERQAELDAFMQLGLPRKESNPTKPSNSKHENSIDLSSDERLAAALRDAKFARLHGGDIGGFTSQSEARIAYLNKAAFYAGHDRALMDRWFRASSLDQTKWDTGRGDTTFAAKEIEEACSFVTDDYDPKHRQEEAAAVEAAEEIIAESDGASSEVEQLRRQLEECRRRGAEYLRQRDAIMGVLRNRQLSTTRKVVGIVAIFELDKKERRNPGEKHLLYRAAVADRAGISESAAGDALKALAGPGGIFTKETRYKTFQETDRQTGEIVERRRRVSEFALQQTEPVPALKALAAYGPEPEPDKSTWGGRRIPHCKQHPAAGVLHFESFRCKQCHRLLGGNEYVPTDQVGDLCGQVAPIGTPTPNVVTKNGHLDPIGVQRAQAELMRLGALLGWPELPFARGSTIGRGEANWQRFAEFANGTLTTAVDAAAAAHNDGGGG